MIGSRALGSLPFGWNRDDDQGVVFHGLCTAMNAAAKPR
jgi:hypothetical protein